MVLLTREKINVIDIMAGYETNIIDSITTVKFRYIRFSDVCFQFYERTENIGPGISRGKIFEVPIFNFNGYPKLARFVDILDTENRTTIGGSSLQ